jgi:hypothetical protein
VTREAGNKGREMGVKMTGKNGEKSWCGWFCHIPEVTQGKGIKTTRRFEGPFEVTEKLSDITYRLRIPHEYDIHPVISIAHLEKYTQSPEEFGERKELEPLRRHQKTTEEYEVLEIVEEHKIKKRGRYYKEYKCNWKGHGITDEWIPEKNLRNAQELLQEWIQKKAKNHRRK